MYSFDYEHPGTLAAALELYAATEDAIYLAGGQTLIPTLKQRLRRATTVIDLSRIEELRGIRASSEALTIGAMTCHSDVAESPQVQRAIPGIAVLAGHIGDQQVRSHGTLGGSIANNDPAADYPAAVLGLDATVHTCRRAIAADSFFTGLFETSLEPGEVLVKVAFRIPKRAAYCKFRNPASRYAVVGVMVADFAEGVRVAVTGAKTCAFRLPAMEAALTGSFREEALDGISVPPDDLNGDIHASSQLRAHLIWVMARRAVARIA